MHLCVQTSERRPCLAIKNQLTHLLDRSDRFFDTRSTAQDSIEHTSKVPCRGLSLIEDRGHKRAKKYFLFVAQIRARLTVPFPGCLHCVNSCPSFDSFGIPSMSR